MSRQQPRAEGDQQPQNRDPLHGLPDRVPRQPQVEAAIEQNQADQEADQRTQTRTQVERLHQTKAVPTDQQP